MQTILKKNTTAFTFIILITCGGTLNFVLKLNIIKE